MRPRRAEPLGTLTRQPLPEPDASIDALADEARALCGTIWAGRAVAEAHASLSFRFLAPVLVRLGEPELAALATRAVFDEERHSEIARRVATAYLGREPALEYSTTARVPAHPGASDELRDTLHVLGQCALNETTACAFLERCIGSATAPLPRAALREFLGDDIDHSRIGWAHLASPRLGPERRAAIGPWLLSMVAANHRMWGNRPASLAHLAAHGCLEPLPIEKSVRAAIHDLIIPGFDRMGIDTTATAAWAEALPPIDAARAE